MKCQTVACQQGTTLFHLLSLTFHIWHENMVLESSADGLMVGFAVLTQYRSTAGVRSRSPTVRAVHRRREPGRCQARSAAASVCRRLPSLRDDAYRRCRAGCRSPGSVRV